MDYVLQEFTATWLEKYHSVAYNLRCPVLTGAAGLQRGVKASPGNARKTKHANVSEVGFHKLLEIFTRNLNIFK